MPVRDTPSHILPLIIGDAHLCRRTSELLLERAQHLRPADQLPDRSRAGRSGCGSRPLRTIPKSTWRRWSPRLWTSGWPAPDVDRSRRLNAAPAAPLERARRRAVRAGVDRSRTMTDERDYSPAAFLSASLILSCQPGPRVLQVIEHVPVYAQRDQLFGIRDRGTLRSRFFWRLCRRGLERAPRPLAAWSLVRRDLSAPSNLSWVIGAWGSGVSTSPELYRASRNFKRCSDDIPCTSPPGRGRASACRPLGRRGYLCNWATIPAKTGKPRLVNDD